MKPITRNRRLELTGLPKPDETHGWTGPDLADQESAAWVFGRVWDRTDSLLRSKPGPLAGYPDPLLTPAPATILASYNTNLSYVIGRVTSFTDSDDPTSIKIAIYDDPTGGSIMLDRIALNPRKVQWHPESGDTHIYRIHGQSPKWKSRRKDHAKSEKAKNKPKHKTSRGKKQLETPSRLITHQVKQQGQN